MKSNLFWFIEGQTQFSTSGHAQMSLTLNEPIQNVLCSNLHTTSKHAPKTYQTWKFCKQNNQLCTKSHDELEQNSHVRKKHESTPVIHICKSIKKAPMPFLIIKSYTSSSFLAELISYDNNRRHEYCDYLLKQYVLRDLAMVHVCMHMALLLRAACV